MSGIVVEQDNNILLPTHSTNSLSRKILLVSVFCIVFPAIASSAVIVIIGVVARRGQRRHFFPGLRFLGVEDSKSNISDQYDERYSKSASAAAVANDADKNADNNSQSQGG